MSGESYTVLWKVNHAFNIYDQECPKQSILEKAGTGKSTGGKKMAKLISERLNSKYAVLSLTSVAYINIESGTLHSTLQ